MSIVNPAAVEVLTRTDMPTLLESAKTQDFDMIRMANGKKPTDAERDLIFRAGPQDFRAAADHMKRDAELEYTRHQKRMELVDLIGRHALHPQETTEAIVARMSLSEQEEFFDLAGYFQ